MGDAFELYSGDGVFYTAVILLAFYAYYYIRSIVFPPTSHWLRHAPDDRSPEAVHEIQTVLLRHGKRSDRMALTPAIFLTFTKAQCLKDDSWKNRKYRGALGTVETGTSFSILRREAYGDPKLRDFFWRMWYDQSYINGDGEEKKYFLWCAAKAENKDSCMVGLLKVYIGRRDLHYGELDHDEQRREIAEYWIRKMCDEGAFAESLAQPVVKVERWLHQEVFDANEAAQEARSKSRSPSRSPKKKWSVDDAATDEKCANFLSKHVSKILIVIVISCVLLCLVAYTQA